MTVLDSTAKSQQELLDAELQMQNTVETKRLNLPGIEKLHTKPTDEIAAVLTNVLKSHAGVTEVRWVLGECIELKYNTNPQGQLRG